jgi:hypothetical protein
LPPKRRLVNASAKFLRCDSATTRDSFHERHRQLSLPKKRLRMRKRNRPYFNALRTAMPELENIATGKEPRPRELDQFATNFSLAGEEQEQAADEATLFLPKRLSFDPDPEKARAEFERAQKAEERLHKDLDGLDFSNR